MTDIVAEPIETEFDEFVSPAPSVPANRRDELIAKLIKGHPDDNPPDTPVEEPIQEQPEAQPEVPAEEQPELEIPMIEIMGEQVSALDVLNAYIASRAPKEEPAVLSTPPTVKEPDLLSILLNGGQGGAPSLLPSVPAPQPAAVRQDAAVDALKQLLGQDEFEVSPAVKRAFEVLAGEVAGLRAEYEPHRNEWQTRQRLTAISNRAVDLSSLIGLSNHQFEVFRDKFRGDVERLLPNLNDQQVNDALIQYARWAKSLPDPQPEETPKPAGNGNKNVDPNLSATAKALLEFQKILASHPGLVPKGIGAAKSGPASTKQRERANTPEKLARNFMLGQAGK